MIVIKILATIALVILFISLAWRYFSLRYSIPCPAWLSKMIERDNPFAKVHHAKTIIENAQVKEGMIVLDAGCGPGRVTIPAAEKVGQTGRVVAMDLQQACLIKTRGKAAEAHVQNIDYLQAGLGEGKLEEGKFDRALLVTVIGEIPKQQQAMQEVYDCLKVGGILSVTEIMTDPHYTKSKKVEDLAERVGFKKCHFHGNAFAYTINFQKYTLDLSREVDGNSSQK